MHFFRLKSTFSVFALVLCWGTAWSQVIWEENFEGYGEKVVLGLNKNQDNPAPDWTSNAGDCDGGGSIQGNLWVGDDHWGTTANGRFLCQDVEGLTCCGPGGTSDNELVTEIITLPPSTDLARMEVQITMDGSQNDFEPCTGVCDNAEDPISVAISLDGGPFNEVCNNGTNCNLDVFNQSGIFSYSASEEFIEASTVQFKIITGNKAQDEKFYLDLIRLEGFPEFTLNTASGCANSNIQVSVSGGSATADYQYNWSTTGLVSSTGASATYNFASTGQQPISVAVVAGGCTRTINSSINVLNSLDAQIAGPDGLCVGDIGEYELTGPSAENGSVMWDGVLGARLDDADENPNRYQFGSTGSFTIKATITDGGCSAEISKAIAVEPRPTLSVSASENVACGGAPINLTATTTDANTVAWSTDPEFNNLIGTGSPITVNPNSDTIYYARATGNYCEEIASITIPALVSPLPAEDLVCDRTNGVQLNATVNQAGTAYQWSEDPNFTTIFATTPTTTVNPGKTTNYYVQITSGNCVITDTITVYAFDTGLPAQEETCRDGDVAELIANSDGLGSRWAWSTNANFSPILSADSVYRVSPENSTTYYVKISTDFCDYVQQVDVVPFRAPELQNITACLGNNVTLGPQNPGNYAGATYSWSPIQSSSANPTITAQATSDFSLEMTFGKCEVTLSQSVFVESLQGFLPNAEPIFYCDPDEPITIESNVGGADIVNYRWSNGGGTVVGSGPSISYAPGVNNLGKLFLEVQTANGCNFLESVDIDGVGAIPGIISEYYFCKNDGVPIIVDTASSSYKNYPPQDIFWSSNPPNLFNTPFSKGIEVVAYPQTYAEVIVNYVFPDNCIRTRTAAMDLSKVYFAYPPDMAVTKNSLFEGESFTVENLNPPPEPSIFTSREDSIYFTWMTLGIEDDDSLVYQTYEASSDLDYVYFKMADPFCSYIDSVDIRSRLTEKECREPFVPNAFSPNDDGQNDKLRVRAPNLEALYFTVYDRWGTTVYESEIQSEGWDGTYKGKPLNPGVYVYYVEAACGQEIYNLKGNTTLLR